MDAVVSTVSVHHSLSLHGVCITITKIVSIDAAINRYTLQVVTLLIKRAIAQSVARQRVTTAAKKGM